MGALLPISSLNLPTVPWQPASAPETVGVLFVLHADRHPGHREPHDIPFACARHETHVMQRKAIADRSLRAWNHWQRQVGRLIVLVEDVLLRNDVFSCGAARISPSSVRIRVVHGEAA